jgi:hypothetical protein
MKSKFGLGAYLLAFLIVLFSIMLCAALSVYFLIAIPVAIYIILNVFCVFSWIWLVFGELRTKVIRVEIGYDSIAVKGYFGLGAPKTYYFNEIEGYKISILPASGAVYEYLYIIAGDKKVVKLSQFYHKNYVELKEAIAAVPIKYLGFENFSYGRELKEIFV